MSEGWGVTFPGGQGIFDPWWGGLIKALTCPGHRGALTPMCVLRMKAYEKKCIPQDNFWNSPKSLDFLDALLPFVLCISETKDAEPGTGIDLDPVPPMKDLSLVTFQNARATTKCVECRKPRVNCVFTPCTDE